MYRYIKVAPKVECKDMNHLERFCEEIVAEGGEGIILRDPTDVYQPGRSHGFLKHKVKISFPNQLLLRLTFRFNRNLGMLRRELYKQLAMVHGNVNCTRLVLHFLFLSFCSIFSYPCLLLSVSPTFRYFTLRTLC